MRFIGFGFIEPQGWKKEMLTRQIARNPSVLERMLKAREINLAPDELDLIKFFPMAYRTGKNFDYNLVGLDVSKDGVALVQASADKGRKVLYPNFLLNKYRGEKKTSTVEILADLIKKHGLENFDIDSPVPGTIQASKLDPKRFLEKLKLEIKKLP